MIQFRDFMIRELAISNHPITKSPHRPVPFATGHDRSQRSAYRSPYSNVSGEDPDYHSAH
jgi:hypothetical protein